MSEPFIAEVRMWGCNFAPRGWAMCDGQLLPISQNTALFSLIGTTYGGDGRTTTGLPDLQGRAAMHEGNGPGLIPRQLGQKLGAETVTLQTNQVPPHTHSVMGATAAAGPTNDPASGQPVVQAGRAGAKLYGTATPGSMKAAAINSQGGGQPHNNMQPYNVVVFTIALVGQYPSRA